MKALTLALLVLFFCLSSVQAGGRIKQRFGVGTRYHAEQDTEIEVAFDDESTYGIVYEYHEGGTFWQLGAQYGAGLGTNDVDYVVTPEINLMLTDGAWRGGIGALATYVSTDEDSDWSDIYYQLILGFDIPLGQLALSLQAAYVFDDFDNLSEFDFDELDWAGYLSYQF